MRNTFLIILATLIIIFVIVLSRFYDYRDKEKEIMQYNLKYEEYLDGEIVGRDIATVINKAINDNEKANLTKDDEEYINIDIKIIDLKDEMVYNMEVFYTGGIAQFVQYYGSVKFKCTEIKYSKSKKVNFILFEQMR